MKKILVIFIMFIFLLIPGDINADTYNEALDKASIFLEKNEYKNSYLKYLFTNGSNKYTELISKEEFDLTRYDKNMNYRSIGYSYLWDSRPFWSNTNNLPIRDGYIPIASGDNTDNIGTRVTQLLKNDVSVFGSGTYTDPWLFSPQYRVRIKVNDESKGFITNSSYSKNSSDIKYDYEFIYTAGSSSKKLYIYSNGANQYLGSTCGYVVNGLNANDQYTDSNGVGGYLLISNITRDTECIINFGEKPKKVILDKSYSDIQDVSPLELYMSPDRGWYSDKFGNYQIVAINSNPQRLGYIYEGYRVANNKDSACSSSVNIIEPPYKDLASNGYELISNSKNKQLNINKDILKNIENNTILYACYTPIRYSVQYNCTNGVGASWKSDHIYDVEFDLDSNKCTRVGYEFSVWSTNSDGTGSTYNNNALVKNIFNEHKGTLNLYSQWKAKTNIVYVVKHWLQKGDGGTEHNSTNYENKYTDTKNNGVADENKIINSNTYEGFSKPTSQTVHIKPDGSTVVNFYYIRNTYKVDYNCNEGEGTTDSSIHKYDVSKALTKNTCTRKGYKFDGWATSSGGNVVYTDSQSVKNLSVLNDVTVTLFAKWSKCGVGTYGSNGTSCSSCPTGYTSAIGSDSINDCYLITTAGKYVATANNDQTTCAVNGYCPGGTTVYYGNVGGRNNCPANYTTSPSGSDAASDCYLTTTSGNYVATANATQATCAANGYCSGGIKVNYGSIGGRSNCPTNYGTSPAGSDAASDCYLITATGKYVSTANAAQTSCAANGYCSGGIKVNYGSIGGRSNCPANYGTSPAGSDAASDCYLTTTAGNYVATANAAQATCTANYYCGGGSKIYYGKTGGRSACPTNYGTSPAGSDAESDCYLTTTAGNYVATANAAQTTCTANYYCGGGTKIYYGKTGGRSACPTNYGSSSSGSDAASDCYLTTTAGNYVATANAAQTTCTANYYCSGGTKIYYGKTGGRSACSTGYHSSAGASSCSANTYTVVYNKNSSSASGSMSNSSHTYDTAKNLTANAFSRSGYTFNGWNTKADGSGTSYSNKASVKNLTSTNNGTVNLYAKWKLAVSCDNAAITYYNQNEYRSPIPCNIYNGVYDCSPNTSTGKCDCVINAFYSGSKYYCCNFDKTSISATYNSSAGKYQCVRSYNPVSKSGSCSVVGNSYNWCSKYW